MTQIAVPTEEETEIESLRTQVKRQAQIIKDLLKEATRLETSQVRHQVWIVVDDLPANNSRRSFYRRIRRYLKKHGIGETANWSTQSVVITGDKAFAEYVYQQATLIGHAHLYKAEQIK